MYCMKHYIVYPLMSHAAILDLFIQALEVCLLHANLATLQKVCVTLAAVGIDSQQCSRNFVSV